MKRRDAWMLSLAFCCLWTGCTAFSGKPARQRASLPDTSREAPALPQPASLAPMPVMGAVPAIAAPGSAGLADPGVRLVTAEMPLAPQPPEGTAAGPEATAELPPRPRGSGAELPPSPPGAAAEVVVAPEPQAVDAPDAVGTPAGSPGALRLDDVLLSVRATYPLLAIAAQERSRAAGEQLAAAGYFDLYLTGSAIAQPQGNYENYRYDALMKQPLWSGGDVYAGYRLGDGIFEPWYQERETEEGGEVRAGLVAPLAQDRPIDKRRAEVLKAQWERMAVEPAIQIELIGYLREASYAYWDWLAAGQNYRIAERLLRTAEDRTEALEQQVAAGDVERIVLIDNERLIVSRQAKLVEARQKLETSAIKLSLYLRSRQGAPMVPSHEVLPQVFPAPEAVDRARQPADLQQALSRRPEIRELDFARRKLDVELSLAQNYCLPAIDATMNASQDLGGATSPKNDKGEAILEVGLLGEVPLQRRMAAGSSRALEAKIAQNTAKQRFARDKITVEVNAAYTALLATYEQYQQAVRAVELNRQMEEFERQKLALGESNLLLLNLREQATADAATAEVLAALAFHQAMADLRAAMAADIDLSGPRG